MPSRSSRRRRNPVRLASLASMLLLPLACGDSSGPIVPGECPDVVQADLAGALSCAPTHGAIEGRVVDAVEGEAIVGALVATSPTTATAVTDAGGRFEIEGIDLTEDAGTFSVTAATAGYASASETVVVGETVPRASVDLALEPVSDRALPDPGGAGEDLAVRVLHRDRPVRGARVELLDPNGEVGDEAATDANGFALFAGLESSSWTVHATATIADRPFEGYAGVTLRAGETGFVRVDLRRVF